MTSQWTMVGKGTLEGCLNTSLSFTETAFMEFSWAFFFFLINTNYNSRYMQLVYEI